MLRSPELLQVPGRFDSMFIGKGEIVIVPSWVSSFECYIPGDWKCWHCVTTIKNTAEVECL